MRKHALPAPATAVLPAVPPAVLFPAPEILLGKGNKILRIRQFFAGFLVIARKIFHPRNRKSPLHGKFPKQADILYESLFIMHCGNPRIFCFIIVYNEKFVNTLFSRGGNFSSAGKSGSFAITPRLSNSALRRSCRSRVYPRRRLRQTEFPCCCCTLGSYRKSPRRER